MAQDNLKDHTLQWVTFGFLFFALLSFSITFTANNNPDALNGTMRSQFVDTKTGLDGSLNLLPIEANTMLNVSAKTNPEESYLGSQDVVSTGYKYHGTAKGFLQDSVSFFELVFGDAGGVILVVVGSLLGFLSVYFIYKWIKGGY